MKQVITMPAGCYILGDPCYCFPNHKDWSDLLEQSNFFETTPKVEFKGFTVLSFNTAYGDGEYLGSNGKTYPVDAGMIGLVDVRLVGGPAGKETVLFTEDFTCTNNDGFMTFGPLVIDTKYQGEDLDD